MLVTFFWLPSSNTFTSRDNHKRYDNSKTKLSIKHIKCVVHDMTQHMEVLQWWVWTIKIENKRKCHHIASMISIKEKLFSDCWWCLSLTVGVGAGVIESLHLHIRLWWPNPWMVNAQIIGIGDTLLSRPKLHTNHLVFQMSQHHVHIPILHTHLDCGQPFITYAIAELNENRPTQRTHVLPPSH